MNNTRREWHDELANRTAIFLDTSIRVHTRWMLFRVWGLPAYAHAVGDQIQWAMHAQGEGGVGGGTPASRASNDSHQGESAILKTVSYQNVCGRLTTKGGGLYGFGRQNSIIKNKKPSQTGTVSTLHTTTTLSSPHFKNISFILNWAAWPTRLRGWRLCVLSPLSPPINIPIVP